VCPLKEMITTMPDMTRRQLLLTLPAVGTVAGHSVRMAFAQGRAAPIRVRGLNHFGIAVSDTRRSVEFYQGLFGMPVQARSGTTTILRVGAGPQFLSIAPVAGNASPRITHYCLGVEDFDVERVVATLAVHGVTRAAAVAPMKVVVTTHDTRADLMFGDPDGIVCQVEDVSYCGGAGPRGSRCAATEPSPTKGLIALKDLNHLTIASTDSQRSNSFYRGLFGFSIRSYQGPTAPTLAVGPATQFLMFTSGGGAAQVVPRRAGINHACWTVDGFKPETILTALESYGLRPRESAQGPTGPLRYYVSMRMENRGGAPGGTPELYFTDPDGLVIQLQDTSYCGGSGFLGNECSRT
jgi:catechol 2,3-dioxygenase-like lactoylglutathione lyase family enzyme